MHPEQIYTSSFQSSVVYKRKATHSVAAHSAMGQDPLLHGKTIDFSFIVSYHVILLVFSQSIRSDFSGYVLPVGRSKLLLLVHFSEFLTVRNWEEDIQCHLDTAYQLRGRMKKSLMSISTIVNLFSAWMWVFSTWINNCPNVNDWNVCHHLSVESQINLHS